jgi:hypothetical protein
LFTFLSRIHFSIPVRRTEIFISVSERIGTTSHRGVGGNSPIEIEVVINLTGRTLEQSRGYQFTGDKDEPASGM